MEAKIKPPKVDRVSCSIIEISCGGANISGGIPTLLFLPLFLADEKFPAFRSVTEREEEKLSRVQIENGREGLEVLLKTLASCNVPGTL